MLGETWRNRCLILVAAALPLVIITTISAFAGFVPATPDVFLPEAMDVQSATNAASTLTNALLSLAIGMVIALGYLLKDTPQRAAQLVLAAIGLSAATASIYASYRFQSALAEQLATYRLDLDRIRDRLDLQSWTLLVATSCLAALFAQRVLDAGRPAARQLPPSRENQTAAPLKAASRTNPKRRRRSAARP